MTTFRFDLTFEIPTQDYDFVNLHELEQRSWKSEVKEMRRSYSVGMLKR
jgi:hypothetical protein